MSPTSSPAHELWHRVRFTLGLTGLLALYFFLAFYKLGAIPLIDPDEPRYAGAGRTMSRALSNDSPRGAIQALLIPEFNGTERINKPPLFYWLVASSNRISGRTDEVSARLPSILMGLLTLLGTVFVARRIFGDATALLSGAILTTFILFAALSRCCITDMTFSTFLCAALGLWMLGELNLLSQRRALWLSCLALGMAMLTKATATLSFLMVLLIYRAFYVPSERRPQLARFVPWILILAVELSVFALWWRPSEEITSFLKYAPLALSFAAVAILILTAFRSEPGPFSKSAWPLAFGLALLVGMSWYVMLYHQFGAEKFWQLITFETAGRLTGEVHRQAMTYYILVLAGISMPWAIGFPSAILSAWPSQQRPLTPHTRADQFLLAWVLGIVLFFSIPGAKLATYVLPTLPALAILLARFMLRLSGAGEPISSTHKRITLAFAGIVFTGLLIVAAVPHFDLDEQRLFFISIGMPLVPFATGLGVLIAGPWILAVNGRPWSSAAIQAALVMAAIIYFLPHANTLVIEHRSNRALCRSPKVQAALQNSARVVSLGADIESLSYYLDREIVDLRLRRGDPRRKAQPSLGYARDAISAELRHPAPVLIFMNRRFFNFLYSVQTDTATFSECEYALPREAELLAKQGEIVAIRNRTTTNPAQ